MSALSALAGISSTQLYWCTDVTAPSAVARSGYVLKRVGEFSLFTILPFPVTFRRQICASVDVYESMGGASGRTGRVEGVRARIA